MQLCVGTEHMWRVIIRRAACVCATIICFTRREINIFHCLFSTTHHRLYFIGRYVIVCKTMYMRIYTCIYILPAIQTA